MNHEHENVEEAR